MSSNIQRPNAFPLNSLPVKTGGAEQLSKAVGNFAGKALAAAGQMQTVGLATFNSMSGVSERADSSGALPLEQRLHRKQHHPQQRRQQSSQQRSRSTSSANKAANATLFGDEDEDQDESTLPSKIIGRLRESGQHQLSSQLSSEVDDPLDRYALLHNAMCQLDEDVSDKGERDKLKATFEGMLFDLAKRHGEKIREGLKKNDDLPAGSEAAPSDGKMPPKPTVRQLRFQYGATVEGNVDHELVATVMSKILDKKFKGNFERGLQDLRSQLAKAMGPDLNNRRNDGVDARYKLALADARACATAQSVYKDACELKAKLADRAKVACKVNNGQLTGILLKVSEIATADNLLSQICDIKKATPSVRGMIAAVTRETIKQMHDSMWYSDKSGNRDRLLTSLHTMIVEADQQYASATYKQLTPMQRAAEKKEREWRIQIARNKKARTAKL
jgi:hypothetical protein